MNPRYLSAIRRVTIPNWSFEKRDTSFDFDDVAHEYRLKGNVILGATGAMKRCGWIDTTYYTEAGRQRGTWVHQAIHYSEEGDLHWPEMPPWVQGYLDAYKRFKDDWKFKARLREIPLYHPEFLYGVIPDGEGLVLDGEPAIVELKTGIMPWWTKYQTALQELAIRAWEKNPFWRRRFGVELHADGTYKPQEFKNNADYVRAQCGVIAAQCNENKPRKDQLELVLAQ
jgi:hypothetical protein